MSLRNYMKPVACVSPDATIVDACREMQQREVGCVIVCGDDDWPVGVLTDRDVALRCVAEQLDARVTPVDRIMSRGVHTLPTDASIEQATELLRRHGVRRIPIVDEERHVVGLVSFDDLVLLLGMEIGNLAGAIYSEQVSQPIDTEHASPTW